MELIDIVRKLVGPIEPVGGTRMDGERLKNLRVLTALVDDLLTDIDKIIAFKHRPEHSIRLMGEHASEFFDRIGIEE